MQLLPITNNNNVDVYVYCVLWNYCSNCCWFCFAHITSYLERDLLFNALSHRDKGRGRERKTLESRMLPRTVQVRARV